MRMQWDRDVAEESARRQKQTGQAVWSWFQDVGAASGEQPSVKSVCERTITSGDLCFKDSEGGEAQPEKSHSTSTKDDKLVLIQQGAKASHRG